MIPKLITEKINMEDFCDYCGAYSKEISVCINFAGEEKKLCKECASKGFSALRKYKKK
jgi:hypothetical protein